MQIRCPWCGLRDESEFAYGGDANPVRPTPSHEVSDKEWEGYLFHHNTEKDVKRERWLHSYGCRQWFNVRRDLVTHEVTEDQ